MTGKAFEGAMIAGAWVSLVLDFVGWVLLLSGVSAMQQACGSSNGANLPPGGVSGYNSPVPCDHFFGYTWWITFYNLAFLIAGACTLIFGLNNFRPGAVAMAAIVVMQSSVTANTFLKYNEIDTSGLFTTRAQVTTAGAIIKAVAAMLFICCLGVRDESKKLYDTPTRKTVKTTADPVPGPPPSQNVLEG